MDSYKVQDKQDITCYVRYDYFDKRCTGRKEHERYSFHIILSFNLFDRKDMIHRHLAIDNSRQYG